MMWRTDKGSPGKKDIALTSWRDKNKCLFTPKRALAINQEMILFNYSLSESMTLLSLLTSVWVEDYMQECGRPPNSCVTVEFHPSLDERFPISAK